MTTEQVHVTYEDLTEIYETLNSVGQFIKRFEQAAAALELIGKPPEGYTPLGQRVMATQQLVGAEVGRIHNARQQQPTADGG